MEEGLSGAKIQESHAERATDSESQKLEYDILPVENSIRESLETIGEFKAAHVCNKALLQDCLWK